MLLKTKIFEKVLKTDAASNAKCFNEICLLVNRLRIQTARFSEPNNLSIKWVTQRLG